jgi:hypothetical protein
MMLSAAATASSSTTMAARHLFRNSSLFSSRAALLLSGCGDTVISSATTAVGGSSRQQLLAAPSRGFSSNSSLELPRITERRPNETGRGGRASDAGLKVAVFGATGFLGRYVCSGLGEYFIICC